MMDKNGLMMNNTRMQEAPQTDNSGNPICLLTFYGKKAHANEFPADNKSRSFSSFS